MMTSAPPPRPKMPKPGNTNISTNRNVIPARNSKTSSNSAVPARKLLQKYNRKQSAEMNPPIPIPGEESSAIKREAANEQQHAGQLRRRECVDQLEGPIGTDQFGRPLQLIQLLQLAEILGHIPGQPQLLGTSPVQLQHRSACVDRRAPPPNQRQPPLRPAAQRPLRLAASPNFSANSQPTGNRRFAVPARV